MRDPHPTPSFDFHTQLPLSTSTVRCEPQGPQISQHFYSCFSCCIFILSCGPFRETPTHSDLPHPQTSILSSVLCTRNHFPYLKQFLSKLIIPTTEYPFSLRQPEPRVSFALNCGSASGVLGISIYR